MSESFFWPIILVTVALTLGNAALSLRAAPAAPPPEESDPPNRFRGGVYVPTAVDRTYFRAVSALLLALPAAMMTAFLSWNLFGNVAGAGYGPFLLFAVTIGVGMSYRLPAGAVWSMVSPFYGFACGVAGVTTHTAWYFCILERFAHLPQQERAALVFAGNLVILLALSYGIRLILIRRSTAAAPETDARLRHLLHRRLLCLFVLSAISALLLEATTHRWLLITPDPHPLIGLVMLLACLRTFAGEVERAES